MTITNGSVSIEDGLKAKEEYAPARKVRVDISFAVPEGDDGEKHLSAAGDLAQAHVVRLLNKAPAPVATSSQAAENPKPPRNTPARTVPVKPPEKTKDDLAKEAGLPTTDTVHKAPAADEDDDLNDLLGDAAPAPVTDAELGKALQDKNSKMKGEDPNWAPAKLRALINEFAGEGKRATDIPAAKRHDFLEKVKNLK